MSLSRPKSSRLVLFTSLPKAGGHTTITIGLVELLRSRYRSVYVLAKEMPGHGTSEEALTHLRNLGVKTLVIRGDLESKIRVLMFFVISLIGRVGQHETRFVAIGMRYFSPIIAAIIGRSSSTYYHITHDLRPSTVKLLGEVEKRFLNLIFISAATAHNYSTIAGSSREYEVVLQPSQYASSTASLQRYPGPVRFGFIGRLSEAKGSKVLLEFQSQCDEECELHVAGLGEYASEFERVSNLGVGSMAVKFWGNYSTVNRTQFLIRFFRSVDYLLVPSQDDREGTPTVILEAIQCGVPVLASNLGGTAGLGLPSFTTGREGVINLVEVGLFATAMRALIRQGPPTCTTCSAARKYYELHFCDSKVVEAWNAILL